MERNFSFAFLDVKLQLKEGDYKILVFILCWKLLISFNHCSIFITRLQGEGNLPEIPPPPDIHSMLEVIDFF